MEDMENKATRAQEDTQQPDAAAAPEAEKEPKQAPRTFTQAEVDKIVQERVARERKKLEAFADGESFENDLIKREKAVTVRELKAEARERFARDKLPESALSLVDYSSPEAFEASYKAVADVVAPLAKEAQAAALRQPAPRTVMASGPLDPIRDPIRDAFRPKKE